MPLWDDVPLGCGALGKGEGVVVAVPVGGAVGVGVAEVEGVAVLDREVLPVLRPLP